MPKYLEIAASKKRNLNWDAVRDVPVPGGLVYDMRKLPMQGVSANTYNGVYNEHFIEHLEKDEGINFFKEMYRVMLPGGTIRTVWPPMEFVNWLKSNEDLTNHWFVRHYYDFLWQGGEHKHLWYKQEMIDSLKELGYHNVKEFSYQKSQVSDFRNIDTPGDIRAFHSAVIEAQKPW